MCFQLKRAAVALIVVVVLIFPALSSSQVSKEILAQGKYIVVIGGCNDCHTSAYAITGGKVAVPKWLEGDFIGFKGAWGTTYAINLRQYVTNLTEKEWVAQLRILKTRPPMPWWSLNKMKETDLIAVHHFIKSLGPSKNKVPAYLTPGKMPLTPVVEWPSVGKVLKNIFGNGK